MGDYYNLHDNILFYEFLYDVLIAFVEILFLIYFIFRIIRNLRLEYIDVIKIVQIVLILIIWVRFITMVVVQITWDIESSGMFLAIFRNATYGRYAFIWLTQFSWYILINHIKTYGMMVNGKPYYYWETQIKKIERKWAIIIFISNIVKLQLK